MKTPPLKIFCDYIKGAMIVQSQRGRRKSFSVLVPVLPNDKAHNVFVSCSKLALPSDNEKSLRTSVEGIFTVHARAAVIKRTVD